MTNRSNSPTAFLRLAAVLVGMVAGSSVTSGLAGAQAVQSSLVGEWRADTPLPNGVVQIFRFDADGSFDLTKALSVDGTYHVDGNKLIETITLPGAGASHTDTATFTSGGDSLIVSESGASAPRVLHRAGPAAGASGIVGDWTIQLGAEMAHYVFDSDGTMHVRARVGDERGKYVIRADTLHLSNDQTFQLPAIARFAIADSVLTLTPPSGKQPRRFHRVSPQ
jgi:hypothetical protein